MDTTEYLDEIQKAAKGEVLGELLFLRLSTRYGVEHSHKLECLAALERCTADCMKRLLARHKISVENFDDAEEFTDKLIETSPLESWTDFVSWMHNIVDPYIALYDRLALAAGAEDKQDLEFLAAHERALLNFLNAEMRGADNSLAPVRALLC